MKKKTAEVLLPSMLLLIDVFYLKEAFAGKKSSHSIVGAYTFPKILGIALAGMCVLAIVLALVKKGDEEKFHIPRPAMIGITVAAMAAFFILWRLVGMFYLWATIFVLFLLFAYRDENGRFSAKNIGFNLLLTAVLMAVIYVLFALVMKVTL